MSETTAADKIMDVIGSDGGGFVTSFVLVADCIDDKGDHVFYYLTSDKQPMTSTLGLLEGAAASNKRWIANSYDKCLEDKGE